MESIIEELYYGNIAPSEHSYRRTGEYAHILKIVARHEEKLTEMLTEAQKETFEKFKDSTSEISSMTEVTAFTLGFKLGLRLTAEAFIGSWKHNTDSRPRNRKNCCRGRFFVYIECLCVLDCS